MRNKLLVLALTAFVVSGCGGQQSLPTPGAGGALSPTGMGVKPQVRQTGEVPVQWRRFHWGSIYGPYYPEIVTGSDGNLWFNDYSGAQLIRMTMTGSTTRFPTASFNPTSLTVGSDGKLYAGSPGLAAIDVMTTSGTVVQHPIPSGDVASYDGLALGPDGNVWLAENKHVARITTAGVVTEYSYTSGDTSNSFGSVAAGPDGNVWATEYPTSKVDKIIPSTGVMTSFTLTCNPTGIVSAAGALWVLCGGNLLQVTTAGAVTTYYNAFSTPGSGENIAVGPDGNPWFTTNGGGLIGEFNPSNATMTFYYPPTNYSTDYALTAGPDGNVWTVDTSHTVDVYILNVISATPASMTFPGTGQTQAFTVTEKGTSAWTATSNNTAVATVAQGSPASKFNVTSVAAGTAKVIVTDAKGNSFVVHVTVQ